MQSFIRITLLGVFSAVGVAIAIGLATSADPHPSLATDAFESHIVALDSATAGGEEQPTEPTELNTPVTVTVSSVPLATPNEVTQPTVAPYEPPVAGRMERLEGRLSQAEHAAETNQRLLDSATRLLDRAADLPVSAPEVSTAKDVQSPPADRLARVFKDEGDGGLHINTNDSDIREVLDMLSEYGGLNILASKNVKGTVNASLVGVDVDTALEAILRSTGFNARREGDFIYVGTPEDFANMDYTVDRVNTRIYRPNYVTPAELSTLLTPLLSPQVGRVTVSGPADVGIPPDTSGAGGNDFAGTDVVIVRDYEAVLSQIDQLVNEVDRRPLQVAIEAMILSVRLNDGYEMGVDFEALLDRDNVRLLSGNPLQTLPGLNATSGGLKFGFLDSNLALFINALESIGDTNVIASPRLLCMNKQRAEILIGSQLGYVSTTVTENAATQAIEFLEVGTQLRIRPFISNDGMIRMEVHPELSTGSVRVEEGFTLPDKEVTQVTTNIMVQDSETVIIGGLIREDVGTTTSQIPLFGNLPLVGVAFRQKKETLEKREIIVLITPHIIHEPTEYCEGARAACEFYQRQQIYKDKMSPIGKRYYGNRYLRLARQAWNNSAAWDALRYINMSIHFDSVNREAIQLRNDIVANSPYGDVSVDTHLRLGLAPWNQPTNYHGGAPWMQDSLGRPPGRVSGVKNHVPGDGARIRDIAPQSRYRPAETGMDALPTVPESSFH